MAIVTISLTQSTWEFDELAPIGPPGGFGAVYAGKGPQGPVAVKRLHLTAGQAASREMKLGASLLGRDLQCVVPVFDYGLDKGTRCYFLVMPLCKESLQGYLDRTGPLDANEAIDVSLDILCGLSEVKDVVHRDLKPGNILRHNGRWCLADFGIAKFVEESTSLNTLRGCLTPAFGAPEQWRSEAPSHATDIYALGCIWYCLLTGSPPFSGAENQREAHLNSKPTPLSNVDDTLSSLVARMLRKNADARPTIERCIETLQTLKKKTT
jgi:serine/threonine protein kinase